MGLLNKFIDWILYTSVFAACCSTGLCMATERFVIGHIPHFFSPLHTLVFGSTLFVYNVHYVVKRREIIKLEKISTTRTYWLWRYILLASGILMCSISIFLLPIKIFIACIVLGILSFAYSLPLLPFIKKRRLKDFGLLKIFVLTAVWTIVTSVLPILYHHYSLYSYPFEILIRFVFMFVLCVAFDIRDMQTDLEESIYTLPNNIGIKNSYRLMDGALVLFALLCIIQYIRYPYIPRLVGELVTALVTKIAIEHTHKHPSHKAYLGLIDGMMLFYAVLILLY